MQDNPIPNDVNHFDSLSDEWWDKLGPMRTLHEINPCRLAYVEELAGDLKEKHCLDIGSGAGIFSEALAKKGALVTALDLAPTLIKVAREHAISQDLEIHYAHTSAESWSKSHSNRYDIVCCMELLEHVSDPLSLVQAAASLCKPNGIIFFSTINRTPKAYAFLILAAEYLLNLIPLDTHHYQSFIKPSELTKHCEAANLSPVDIRGLHYNPITHHPSLTSNTSCNYLFTAKPNQQEIK